MRNTARWPPESAGLSTAGSGTTASARGTLSSDWIAANGGCGTPASANTRAHLELVRHPLRRLEADPRELERFGDGGDDRDCAVGGDGEHAVDLVAAADLDHARNVGEVDELADVRRQETERVRVAVDCDDLVPELLHALDRTALVTAAADEEDGRHRVPSALPQVASEPLRR